MVYEQTPKAFNFYSHPAVEKDARGQKSIQ